MGAGIKESLVWSDPILVNTRFGKRWVRSWEIPANYVAGFFVFWNKNKDSLTTKGYSIGKNSNNKWKLSEWNVDKNNFRQIFGTDVAKKIEPTITTPVNTLPTYKVKNISGLRDWQIPIVGKLCSVLEKYGAALDGSETGAGKTYAAVATARELGLNIAVVCPKAVITPWNKVINNHFGMKSIFVLNYESVKTGKYKNIGEWKKISKTSSAEKFVWKIPPDTLLIFDESHKLKGHGTQNSEIAIAAKNQGYPILCCSATNAINPIQLKAVGYILGLYKSGKWTSYLKEHGCEKGRFGWEFSGDKKILSKLHNDIFVNRGVRLKKIDIPDFPENEIIAESYNIGESSEKELKRIYLEMNVELANLKKKSKSTKEWKINALTIQLRALQTSELLKVPTFIEMAEDSIESGMSVVIFCNFSDTIKALAKRLNTNCIVWGDNKNQSERDKNIEDFQTDKSRIILVNIKAGGTGLSLHQIDSIFPRISIISPTFSAIDLVQVLGRIHRSGSKSMAIQKIVYAAGTVEENVCDNLQSKLNNLSIINDNDLSPSPIFD